MRVDSKDLHDINWIGLQGVHEPILLTPTMIEDEEGNQSWILKVDDGNRRLAMLRRCLRQCTNLSLSEIEAWSDHFRQPDGTVSLRNWTAADWRRCDARPPLKTPRTIGAQRRGPKTPCTDGSRRPTSSSAPWCVPRWSRPVSSSGTGTSRAPPPKTRRRWRWCSATSGAPTSRRRRNGSGPTPPSPCRSPSTSCAACRCARRRCRATPWP